MISNLRYTNDPHLAIENSKVKNTELKERLLQKDPTWARDFNPRKLKPISNFKIMQVVEKVERTKQDKNASRKR